MKPCQRHRSTINLLLFGPRRVRHRAAYPTENRKMNLRKLEPYESDVSAKQSSDRRRQRAATATVVSKISRTVRLPSGAAVR